MNNSKGFIYPAVVFMAAVCMLCAGHSAVSFMIKQGFAKQTKEFYTQQNLLQNGILYSIRHIQEDTEGEVKTAYGVVTYAVSTTADKQMKDVKITVKTTPGAMRSAEFQFHLSEKKITHWKEY
ncbi:competence type IV pilus minor pilin ComGG [Bacillus swezeyi]|uniref:competence type IV pilus minor pilin ComGG n=1 Tax=Bacillus swezeyi TaxID=1925020 RepID=UPI0027DDF420|nr:competence type IV pilus minor pilin ComGG [Bacillus swezeyi]